MSEEKRAKAIVVDLDNTVASHGDKRGHFEYEKVGSDDVIPEMAYLVNVYARQSGATVLFVSGREDRCYPETRIWLERHFPGLPFVLLMRRTGDRRPSDRVKAEIYRTAIEARYDVALAFDDRDQDVAMWRGLGFRCLQVAKGDY